MAKRKKPSETATPGGLRGVDTFIDEAIAFNARHPELDEQQQAFGGLLWGAMRAIAECPNCPGRFRVPLDGDWNRLYCPGCGYLWQRTEQP